LRSREVHSTMNPLLASMMLGTWLKSQIWYIANIHNAFEIW
jgi:hypothetical protein